MKTRIIALGVAVLLITIGVAIAVIAHKEPATPVNREEFVSGLEQGVSLKYKKPLDLNSLSEQDKKDKFIARLSSQDPAMLVSVRYEDGLRAVTAISKQELMPMLLGNADKSFPQRFTEYKRLEERQLEVGGKKAAELTFTYKGPNGSVAKQRLLIIIKDENTAIYLAAQAQEDRFSEINTEYFEPVIQSLTFET